MPRKIILNIGFAVLALSGLGWVAFFLWTHLYGTVNSSIPVDLDTDDLAQEGLCQDLEFEQFYQVRMLITQDDAPPQAFAAGYQEVSNLIAHREQNHVIPSLVLHAAHVQLAIALGQKPDDKDLNFMRWAVNSAQYPQAIRAKVETIIASIEQNKS